MMNKAVFLDKDGTLIEEVPYNADPKYIKLTPFAGEGLALMQKMGFKLLILSNQSGIARGYFKLTDMKKVLKAVENLLTPFDVTIDGFYFCPHHPQGVIRKYAKECDCRKPKTGLLKKAEKDFDIDLGNSWMIGDILTDIEAGRRAGCQTIFIDNGNETEWLTGVFSAPDYRAANLLDAANLITYG